jgi:hypothetical protein
MVSDRPGCIEIGSVVGITHRLLDRRPHEGTATPSARNLVDCRYQIAIDLNVHSQVSSLAH